MTNDEIEEFARTSASMALKLSTKNWTASMHLATRLVQLLDAQKPVKPRVWRGNSITVLHWHWSTGCEVWNDYANEKLRAAYLHDGDIFLPGTAPKPTSPPPPVEELEACTKVDWT